MIHKWNEVQQCAYSDLFTKTGHMGLDLNICDVKHLYSCERPSLLCHLQDNISVTSGADNSADIVSVVPGSGLKVEANLNTENHEVSSACLLFGNQHGISMEPSEELEKMTLYLGCEEGYIYKFEKEGEDEWKNAGQHQVGSRIIDILQIRDGLLMLCQDAGVFDFLDADRMNPTSHNILQGVTSSCKTRLLSRGGQFAIADVKGLLLAHF